MLADQAADSEVPICLAYDQSHYEPLVPNTEDDIRKTIELKQVILEGRYERTMADISFLSRQMKSQNLTRVKFQ